MALGKLMRPLIIIFEAKNSNLKVHALSGLIHPPLFQYFTYQLSACTCICLIPVYRENNIKFAIYFATPYKSIRSYYIHQTTGIYSEQTNIKKNNNSDPNIILYDAIDWF